MTRTFIACVLDWISSWLSFYADHIGSPDIYEDRLSIPLPGELWRSWKIQWQLWNAPVPDGPVTDDDWTPDWRERMRSL